MRRGFTLVELVLVMGIMASLFGIMTVKFFGVQGKNLLVEGVDILVTDMRSQQTKAMTGSVPLSGVEQPGYGIHFGTDTYTLFDGDTYNAAETSNSVIELPAGTEVTATTFPSANVVFLRGSGESAEGAVTLTNASSGSVRVIRINRLGVVVEGI